MTNILFEITSMLFSPEKKFAFLEAICLCVAESTVCATMIQK